MKRTPLRRKTPLRANPEKVRAWKNKPYEFKKRSKKRASQERSYLGGIQTFLDDHRICPVTNQRTTQIHHSAKRHGAWINLKRYWIAVSDEGHKWIEENKAAAEKLRLMVRIYETYEAHVAKLIESAINLDTPLYYESE